MKNVRNVTTLLVVAVLQGWAMHADLEHSIILDERTLPRPRWVLVLSGGGARGIAQIGVLRVLEQERLYPTAVVGTSIGAAIGALWCAGYTADEIDSLVRSITWRDLFRIGDERMRSDLFLDQKAEYDRTVFSLRMDNFQPVVPEAVSTGQRLELLLAELFWKAPYQCSGNFDQLKIPFRAVATDLVRGETVVLRNGDLATAVRASSTFPLRYTPVRQDSMLLVDGGLLANIPVHIAEREFQPDLVVVVNTTSPLLAPAVLDKPWNVADQVVTLMMHRINRGESAMAWQMIVPELGNHSTLDFSHFEWLIAQGEHAARRYVTDLAHELARRQLSVVVSVLGLPSTSDVQLYATTSTATATRPAEKTPAADLISLVAEYGAVICSPTTTGDSLQVRPHPSRQIAVVRSANQWLSTILQPLVGQYYAQRRIDSLVERIHRHLRRDGLPLARVRLYYDSAMRILDVVLDSGRLAAVELRGNRSATDLIVRRELCVRTGEPIRTQGLVGSWERLVATDLFSAVALSAEYLDPNSDVAVLRIHVRERGNQVLRIGGRIDNERNAQPTLEIADLNLLSLGIRATARLGGGGRNSIGTLRFDVPRILDSYWTASIEGYWDSRNIYLYRPAEGLPPQRYERLRDGERIEQHLGLRTSIGSHIETLGLVAITLRYEYQRGFQLGDYATARTFAPLLALGWSTTFDDEDRADFPTRGTYMRLALEQTLMGAAGWLQFFKTEAAVRTTTPLAPAHVLRWTVRFGLAANTLPLLESFNLGGEDVFYGMREEEERGRQLLLGQLEYRLRLPIELVFPSYFSLRYDLGAVWNVVQAIKMDNLQHGIGLSLAFDTPVGPARFSLGRAFYFRGTPTQVTVGPVLGYFSIGMRIQ